LRLRLIGWNDSLSVNLFHVPLPLAAIFLSALARYLDQEKVAAGLRIFWLPLVLSEWDDRLVLAGYRVLLLQNSRFDRGSANRTNFVLSRGAITKRSRQRRKYSENMWDVRRGELSGLSANP